MCAVAFASTTASPGWAASADRNSDPQPGSIDVASRCSVPAAIVRLSSAVKASPSFSAAVIALSLPGIRVRQYAVSAGLAPIHWQETAEAPRGKRVRNDLIKAILGITLTHPTH